MGGVVDDQYAIDNDRRPLPGGVAVRIGIARPVVEVRRIEDRDIGAPALAQQAAIAEFQGARRPSGHLMYRLLQGQQPLVMHVLPDDAWERAVEAGMRHPLADDAIIGDAIAVGADKRFLGAYDGADIVFRN